MSKEMANYFQNLVTKEDKEEFGMEGIDGRSISHIKNTQLEEPFRKEEIR